jgi:hypothetical protein
MREFFIKTLTITVCSIAVARNLPFEINNIHTAAESKNYRVQEKDKTLPFQYIDKRTRFNKETGDIEILRDQPEPYKAVGKWWYRDWSNAERYDYTYPVVKID